MSPELRLREVVERFDVGMLCTTGARGIIDARPMLVAQFDEATFEISFISYEGAGVVEDAESGCGPAAVMFQSDRAFATLAGTMVVSRDQAAIDALWNEQIEAWFERGSHPAVALRLRPEQGRYWDYGARGQLRMVWESTRRVFVDASDEPPVGRVVRGRADDLGDG
ncbi:MAG: pyridoxamine 5'-phosphate oxidase family protein [Myxococcota bacterium]